MSAVHVERIQLIEHHDGDHEPIAQLRRGDGATHTDDDIHVGWAGCGTKGLHQQVKVRGVAGLQDIGLQALDGQHPAQLPRQVAVLALGQHPVEHFPIGEPGSVRAPGGLGEFLFHRKARETGVRLCLSHRCRIEAWKPLLLRRWGRAPRSSAEPLRHPPEMG